MKSPVYRKIAEQKILLHKAHYYALGQLDLELVSLENSYTKDTSNPFRYF